MRSYLIDELSFLECDVLDSALKRSLRPGELSGVFFLTLPQELHGPNQQNHQDCGPFYFTVILEKDSLRVELLVRSSHNLHCSCIARATDKQRDFILGYIDELLRQEMIQV